MPDMPQRSGDRVDIEVALLAGGASRRMGVDKASILVDGMPLIERLAGALTASRYTVTVLGRAPVTGCAFLADAEDYHGPASALSRFEPLADHVFVMPCDVARFDPRVVALMRDGITGWDAVAPVLGDVPQPLCALYRASCFGALRALVAAGERRLQPWLASLAWRPLESEELAAAGLDERCIRGANTPSELRELLR